MIVILFLSSEKWSRLGLVETDVPKGKFAQVKLKIYAVLL